MINKIKCYLGYHSYKILRIKHYVDTSYEHREESTSVVRKCRHCKKIVVKDLYGVGYLTQEELE